MLCLSKEMVRGQIIKSYDKIENMVAEKSG